MVDLSDDHVLYYNLDQLFRGAKYLSSWLRVMYFYGTRYILVPEYFCQMLDAHSAYFAAFELDAHQRTFRRRYYDAQSA